MSQRSAGIHKWNYRLGKSAALALSDLVRRSFDQADVRRLTDAESIQLLVGSPDTSVADFLLLPTFETGGVSESLFKINANVRLRLDVRACRTNDVYSWAATGSSGRVISSQGGLTGSALEQALSALADSLRAYRAQLEYRP